MKPRYCFWSLASGTEKVAMAFCVESARKVGVFKDFHVFTDSEIPGCECYEAVDSDQPHPLAPVIYLKTGISKLMVDYFVWISPQTVFLNTPYDILGTLGAAPVHLPLEIEAAKLDSSKMVSSGISVADWERVMCKFGVLNPPFTNGSAFWIVSRDVIDLVYELAFEVWLKSKEMGLSVGLSLSMGFATQMLCANPWKHTILSRPDLWAPDYFDSLSSPIQSDSWVELPDVTNTIRFKVRPAMLFRGMLHQQLEPICLENVR